MAVLSDLTELEERLQDMTVKAKALENEIENAIDLLCAHTDSKFFNPFGEIALPDIAPPLGQERYIVATGSYAFGKWEPGDTVRLVILSKVSRKTLWAMLAEKLNLTAANLPSKPVIELSANNLSMTADWQPSLLSKFRTLSRKDKGDCKFYLQHCLLPASFGPKTDDCFPNYHHLLDSMRSSDEQSHLKLVLDTQLLATKIDQHFHTKYDTVREWAKSRGVFGSKMALLDSECITWLVLKDLTSSPPGELDPLHQLDSLIKTTIQDVNIYNTTLSILSPLERNVSEHIPSHNVLAIKAALREDVGLEAFVNAFPHYVQIDLSIWGDVLRATQLEDFHNFIAESVNGITSYLHIKFKEQESRGLFARLWPDPVMENEGMTTYIVGLGRFLLPRVERKKKIEHFASLNATELEKMVGTMPKLGKYHANTSLHTREELWANLQINDTRATATNCEGASSPAQTSGDATYQSHRFRTAKDVISRLQWDPKHAGIEYDVGYEDRFEGLMWTALETWVGVVEDEDFIPEHRVVMVRRRDDLVVVWDRRKRIDKTDE